MRDTGVDGKPGFVAHLKSNGDLDGSFGSNGLIDVADPISISVDSDGVYFGDGNVVQRVKSNGKTDPSWNSFDVSVLSDGQSGVHDGFLGGVLPAANHRVWVYGAFSGADYADVFLSQLNSTGALDTSIGDPAFGDVGFLRFNADQTESIAGVARGPDGSIAILENGEDGLSQIEKISPAAKELYEQDFVFGPPYLRDQPGRDGFAEDVVMQSDAKVVVSGSFYLEQNSGDLSGTTLMRFNDNGALDSSFSFDGEIDLFNHEFTAWRKSGGKLIEVGGTEIARLDPITSVPSNSVKIRGRDLIIGGTSHGDHITLTDSGSGKSKVVIVNINGRTTTILRSQIDGALIAAGDGNDTVDLSGTSLDSEIDGQNGNDSLLGGRGNDSVYGEAGNDTLDGGPGNDTFGGGDGTDTITYASRTAPITITDSRGGQSGETDLGVNESEILILGKGNDNVEIADFADTVSVYGGAGDDTIEGDNSGIPSQLFGDAGNDVLSGQTPITLQGGDGNDRLLAGNEGGFTSSLLLGEAGNDTMLGGFESDTFVGGSGIDTVDYSDRSNDLILRIDGQLDSGITNEHDQIMGDVENIIGGSGDDLIVGNPSNNSLVGGDGNDTIWGGSGRDTLDGGAGGDHLHGQSGDDLLLAKDGFQDFLDGGDGADTAAHDAGDIVTNVESFI